MSKVQIISYAAAVLIITVLVFLYTSKASAPQISPKPDAGTESSTEQNKSETNSDSEETSSPINFDESVKSNSLVATSWRWLRTENATGTIIHEPKNSKPFVLSFTASSTIVSQTDCNSLSGDFTQNNFSLSFGPLMSTLMYCEGSKEADYAQYLSMVDSYAIIDNMLRLFLRDNSGTMFFVRIKD